jgi:hypothetical protein
MQDWKHPGWKRLAHTLCAGLLATGLALGATAPVVHAQDQEEAPHATECPRGQGYWRTHSHHGPAPYDDTWAAIGDDGADSEFYESDQTYYEVMWTPPHGNAYYILAAKTIAAELNLAVTGAGPTEAYLEAVALFETYGPDEPALSPPGHVGDEHDDNSDNSENGDNGENGENGDHDSESGLRQQFLALTGELAAQLHAHAGANDCPPDKEDEIENGEEENGEPENGESENGEPENGENNGDESNGDENNGSENTVEATLSAEGPAGVVAGPETAEPNTLAPPFPSLFIPAVVAAP